jgi:hypothetical protein
MTLNQEQIEALFRFCEKKSVRYYDLQVELVDHLAERIEEEMKADHHLDFEAALQKVYKGFGLFGFAHIVQDKEKALRKQHNKLWLKEVGNFFTIPKILLTLLLALFFFTIGGFIPSEVRMLIVCIVWAGGYVFQMRIFNRLQKLQLKKVMLMQYLPVTTTFTPIFLLEQFIFSETVAQNLFVFTAFMLLGTIIHSTFTTVTKQVGTKAMALYPEAFKAA